MFYAGEDLYTINFLIFCCESVPLEISSTFIGPRAQKPSVTCVEENHAKIPRN
jgi:hypothetical protein